MLRFKDPTLRAEFDNVDRRLQQLLVDIADRMARRYGTDTTITHLLRTDADHALIYRRTPQAKRPGNIHGAGRAADLRTWRWREAWILDLMAWINTEHAYGLGADGRERPACIRHDVGRGDHLHVQVPPSR